jgi:glycosyltransferase involved in cell wall biosynthesis
MLKRVWKLCYTAGVWTARGHGCYLAPHRFTRLNESLLAVPAAIALVCPLAEGAELQRAEPCGPRLTASNIEVWPLSMRGGRLSRYIRHFNTLWKLIPQASAACLDMPQEHSLVAGIICRLRRVPYFVRLLGDWPGAILASGPASRTRRLKAFVAESASRYLVRNAALVLTQGKALSAKYSRFNPNAIKADLVHTTLSADAFYERRSGSLHDPIRVISVAGLVPFKGLETLASAISLLLRWKRRAEWWCVGEGPERPALESLARRLGIASHVTFHGYVPLGPDLFRLYRNADVFVLPSKGGEGVPLAMLEAMANSLLVVVTSVGGIPGMIAGGVDGTLVQPGKPDEIATAICSLADDPSLANRMRRAAFEKARQYSAARVWEAQRRLIEATFGTLEQESNESRGWISGPNQYPSPVSHPHI